MDGEPLISHTHNPVVREVVSCKAKAGVRSMEIRRMKRALGMCHMLDNRWLRALAVGLMTTVAALALAACGQPEVQPLLFGEAPWQNGEISLYKVTDIDGNFAGNARFDITRGGSNPAADGWSIRREIVAHGDTEIALVETFGPNLRPLVASLERTNGQGREFVTSTYDSGQVDMELTTVNDVTTYQRESIPSDARDQRTILMMARMLPLERRYAVRFNSYLPVADLLDRVTLAVKGEEDISVPAGTFNTWRLELDTGNSTSDVWIAVDAPNQLVKFVDGRSGGTFELMEYTPGTE